MSLTEQEIKSVAEKKYTQHYNGGHGNGGTTRIDSISINAFIEGAKWMQEQKEEELQIARRDKDMAWLAYMTKKEELKNQLKQQ
jgi:hypothetical protein